MSATIQSGMHPDAESLTAFAEQLLPAAEREQILTHIASCGRCREVVFLAQQAAGEDQPARSGSVLPGKPRFSWFSWRWAWIPAAALAGFVGVAVVQHFRNATTETQMAGNVAQTDSLHTAVPSTAKIETPAPSVDSKPVPMAKPADSFARQEPAPARKERDAAKKFDDLKQAEQKDLGVGVAGPPPMVLSPGVSGGSTHGMIAKAKSSTYDGPSAANQLQQQNMATQQSMTQLNEVQQSQRARSDAANIAVVGGAAPQKAETVNVQPKEEVAPTAPALSAQLDAIQATNQKVSVLSDKVDELNKTKVALPKGMSALSVASGVGRTIALDTKGALYLSEDNGKHWQPIQSQWTGRAILVRTRPVSTRAAAFETLPTTQFELVNESLQTWISSDGKNWKLEPVPLK